MSTNSPEGDARASQTQVLDIARSLATAFIYLDALDRRIFATCEPVLTPAQFHALAAIAAEPGQSLGTLAVRLLCDKANASGLVDRLSAMGLASRDRDPHDARRVLLALTPAGEQALADASDRRSAALDQVIGPITGELANLHRLVEALRAGVDEHTHSHIGEEAH